MRNLTTQMFSVAVAGDRVPQLVHSTKRMVDADEIRPPSLDEHRCTTTSRQWLSAEMLIAVLAMTLGLAFVSNFYLFQKPVAISGLVERIVALESNGGPNAKNKRSSATGAGQFLEGTWLEAIRKHRRDLTQGRSDKDILELRRNAELARETIARVLEQYAAMLEKRRLPVTPGSLYLTYFAGTAGVVALLTGEEKADAASLMASADVTGRTTRDKIIRANPFLKAMTAGDLKNWADNKMRAGHWFHQRVQLGPVHAE